MRVPGVPRVSGAVGGGVLGGGGADVVCGACEAGGGECGG